MGLFDRVTFEDGLDVVVPELDVDVSEVTWQTKTIRRPAMENYKVTSTGRLFRQEVRTESVPEEERPRYDEELGGFESDLDGVIGMFRTIPQGWTDTNYHGIVELHRTIDDEYVSLKAKFTDGDLVELWLDSRRDV